MLASLDSFSEYDLQTLHSQLHMAGGDREGVIAACLQLGDAAAGGDGRLWEEALQWFGHLDADCSAEVRALVSSVYTGGAGLLRGAGSVAGCGMQPWHRA